MTRKGSRLLAIVLLSWIIDASAQRSYFRLYDQNQGLAAGEIAALTQDDEGFIWIGAHRGLLRFDGHEFLRWAPQQLDEVVYELAYGPDDQLLVRTASGRGLHRTAQGFDDIAGPHGASLTALASFGFDARGRLWAVIDKQLWRRDRIDHWQQIEVPGAVPLRIRVLGNDVIVFTASAAWRLRASGELIELLRAPDLYFAAGGGDLPIWLASHFGRGLWRVDADGAHALGRPEGRALDLRERRGTLWVAMDRQLLAIGPGGRTRHMGIADGVPSGGPLLVDREQSLWMGTFVGLLQFPQPDTWHWGEADGLPLEHVYGVVAADGNVWATTWAGLAHLVDDGARFAVDSHSGNGNVCLAAQRGVWVSDGVHLARWRADHFEASDVAASALGNCAVDAAGAWWFATNAGLWRLDPETSMPRQVSLDGAAPDLIWSDADGALHVADEQRICRLRTVDDHSALREDCHPLGAEVLNSVARIDARRTWIAANTGVYEFDGAHARRLPANSTIEGGVVSTLMPSNTGDWWAAGAGVLSRIRPCSDCVAGWDTIETLGQWHGLPGNSAIKVWEAADGDLWVAGNRGIWLVPSSARVAPAHPPPIRRVRARVDGVDQPLDAPISLSPATHRLDLEFAALSYRDRTLLRFRSRLDGRGDWSKPSRDPLLQFAALEPGTYRAEMAASLDGEHWSEPVASVGFDVLPPWYRTWWSRLLFLVAAIGLAAWGYRLRVAALLRVERERTRIAMDLHDELGSGLGSIGVLAGIAAREDLDASERRRLASEIASLSGLLGSGLRSLVWSLRSDCAGLAELGAQIVDHARRLFPDDTPRLTVLLPIDVSDEPLAPELRRNVLLLTLEALHNVARHSAASHVVLTLHAIDSGGLRLSVEDDGRGFDSTQTSAGAGLESMHRRATAIGASLHIDSVPSRGTRIELQWLGGRRIA
jgi:signal transduction histidine kinase/ligand-binding sensor domain-containing protein